MRRILMIALITSCVFGAKAQLKDYFIPSSVYFNETFLYQSEKWENDNGQFQIENRVSYFLDSSGNYKKYIENLSYRYNVLYITLKVHQFYYVRDEKIVDIYSYIEGLSEAIEEKGYDIRDKNNIILKYPTAQWTDNSDPAITKYYKSEFGKITTEYGEYNNCIIVTKTSKAKTSQFKHFEKFKHKSYYAYKLGLVKTEDYENGKLTKKEVVFGGTLVDNFSEYSFYQKKQEAIARMEAERKRIEEKKKLLAFQEERRNTIYDYSKINSKDFYNIENNIKVKIKNIIEQNKLNNISFTIEANYAIDTLFRNSQEINIRGLENAKVEKIFTDFLTKILLSPSYLQEYSINAKAIFKYSIEQSTNDLLLKKNKGGLELQRGNQDIYTENLTYVNQEMSDNPSGKYKIRLYKYLINNERHDTINYLAYKNYCGSASALLSLLVPGSGDYFVNGSQGSMFGSNFNPVTTTISVYGFIGAGLYFKNKSSINYDLYHSSVDQAEIDKFYALANNQNKTSYILMGTGAVLWLWDVIWTAKTGSENKKSKELMKAKLSLTPVLLDNKSIGISLAFNF